MAHFARAVIVAVLAFGCGGAPAPGKRNVITETTVEILDPIAFVGDAELAPTSAKTLDAIASTLEGNPSIKLVEVQAHVSAGDEATRQARADRRAQVVVDGLVARHVEATRLRAKGVPTAAADPKEPDAVVLAIVQRS